MIHIILDITTSSFQSYRPSTNQFHPLLLRYPADVNEQIEKKTNKQKLITLHLGERQQMQRVDKNTKRQTVDETSILPGHRHQLALVLSHGMSLPPPSSHEDCSSDSRPILNM